MKGCGPLGPRTVEDFEARFRKEESGEIALSYALLVGMIEGIIEFPGDNSVKVQEIRNAIIAFDRVCGMRGENPADAAPAPAGEGVV